MGGAISSTSLKTSSAWTANVAGRASRSASDRLSAFTCSESPSPLMMGTVTRDIPAHLIPLSLVLYLMAVQKNEE